jgi:choline dehydrogenase-like flavoprotein
MSRRVLVVGSGPSAVHFAATVLQKGYEVTLLDVGREPPPKVLPGAHMTALKEQLPDPSGYFLGEAFDGVVLPALDREYYGIPPSKNYVFEPPPGFDFRTDGFEPLFSFAQGGLAEAWTGGCYPFNDVELSAFPFSYAALEPHYGEVARRIGITGEVDDLAPFLPVHEHLLPAHPLDPHSATLMEAYRRHRRRINQAFRTHVGRTRVATLSQDLGERRACTSSGRCLWGCPVDALYVPSQTLRALLREPAFRYHAGLEVLRFTIGEGGTVTEVQARPVSGGPLQTFPVDRLVLAAGTLSSATIVLRSVLAATGERVRLEGLMDNRQVLVPFLNLRMFGRPFPEESYQYHLLGLGIEAADPAEYVHGQITTLKTAMLHPIAQQLPFDLRTSLLVTRALHSALGVVNVNFHDRRRSGNTLALDPSDSDNERLQIRYAPDPDEPVRLRQVLGTVRRTLRLLACFVPPGMQHVRPMGASVHYAGVFPMTANGGRWTTTSACQSREFPNLYLVDGSTFPFLPAKNVTFTLMANAARVATVAF